MKFSFLFLICTRAIPIEPEITDSEEPEVTSPEVERLKNAIYAPLMALKRSREDRVGFLRVKNFFYHEPGGTWIPDMDSNFTKNMKNTAKVQRSIDVQPVLYC